MFFFFFFFFLTDNDLGLEEINKIVELLKNNSVLTDANFGGND